MTDRDRQVERQQAGEVAKEFIEKDLLPENVENDVIRYLDGQEPLQALQTALEYRRGGV